MTAYLPQRSKCQLSWSSCEHAVHTHGLHIINSTGRRTQRKASLVGRLSERHDYAAPDSYEWADGLWPPFLRVCLVDDGHASIQLRLCKI